jgi:hypothetical protein
MTEKKQPQQIYIPVQVEKELPSDPGKHFVIYNKEKEVARFTSHKEWYWENKIHSRDFYYIKPSLWLKETQAILLSESEYKKMVDENEKIRKLLKEVCVRANIIFPTKENELTQFKEKFDKQYHLFKELDEALGFTKEDKGTSNADNQQNKNTQL